MMFVPNSDDGLHCLQASLIMGIEAATGQRISLAQAEVATGFRHGVETWPYQMIQWLASNGFEVVHIDALDAANMRDSPLSELRKSGLDEETMNYFMSITDFSIESEAIAASLASDRVRFITERPSVRELPRYVAEGWIPMISLNASALDAHGTDPKRFPFDGHMVVATAADDHLVVIQDPGPPPRPDLHVPLERVRLALRSPTDDSGTVTYIRREGVEHVSA